MVTPLMPFARNWALGTSRAVYRIERGRQNEAALGDYVNIKLGVWGSIAWIAIVLLIRGLAD